MNPIDIFTPQYNFRPGNIPKGSEKFYNTKSFADNELKMLETQIDIDNKAHAKGQKEIKEAIEG